MSPAFDPGGLADRIAGGEPLALARGISHVENESDGFEALLDRLDGRTGRARRIGITGPPGAGKSTLTAALTRHYLEQSLKVGIVAVDPTSPFTGGALLGDRIRMGELSTEPGVFIRSMASRGSLGGLATATREAADLMDAAGYDRVILETLGVGQAELDIAISADTTAVVLVPESGDGVQAMKAGLMEVADLFVINKSDRPGADRLEKEIAVIMSIRFANRPAGGSGGGAGGSGDGAGGPDGADEAWRMPITQTVAPEARGVEEFAAHLDRHFDWLRSTGKLEAHRRAARLRRAHDALLRRSQRDAQRIWRRAAPETLDSGASPYAIARRLYEEFRETLRGT
ncbi:methylmalonyl Co-A mutase-associated GTPase MeaB [Candidatus Palauibacter soopunensis]|uniref:methylmalonyl Co-A mutase-associated GTPase MeaB n=1 Tax=Candidatus Palauibacter soopunensis TaxID=3056739 RepID=UPI002383D38B|nr:methylmalonyl Co-A mutase-associated GTPase MeaB [Candidatus Palauibacter soopunensis]MDE2879249.1 methylmalonyl Co-A mutase-associated GTPase MeaB [Candidatus Palauibacter soopunensis]